MPFTQSSMLAWLNLDGRLKLRGRCPQITRRLKIDALSRPSIPQTRNYRSVHQQVPLPRQDVTLLR